jgi:hypothetical protein
LIDFVVTHFARRHGGGYFGASPAHLASHLASHVASHVARHFKRMILPKNVAVRRVCDEVSVRAACRLVSF